MAMGFRSPHHHSRNVHKRHAFLRRKPIALALIISTTIILLSVASYAAWATTAFSRRVHQRQKSLLCGRSRISRSRTHSSSAAGGGRVASTATSFVAARRRDAGRTPGFSVAGRQTISRMTSLSNNNYRVAAAAADNNADGGFASFLDSLPKALSERVKIDDGGSPIHVIMGNEAGDADSIISALGMGYAQSIAEADVDATTKITSKDDQKLVVPIVGIPRADMALRRDVLLLLDIAGIDADNLLYLDDDVVKRHLLPPAPSSATSSPRATSLTLVDHNRIRSSLSHLSGAVSEIVDHHEDEGAHENVTITSGKRIVAFEDGRASVASTCTLVAERLFRPIDDDPANPTANHLDGTLSLLLLGVVLLDSVNMLPAAGKGTRRDEEAMERLLSNLAGFSRGNVQTSTLLDEATLEEIFPNNDGRPEGALDPTALFEALSGAKNDPRFWASMSVMNCLRIDYKKFLVSGSGKTAVSSIGLSSVLIDMDSLLAKETFHEDLASFLATSEVGLFGIMAVDFRDGQPRREMLLTGSNSGVVDSFADYLLNHPDAAFLEITERKDCITEGEEAKDASIRVFQQGNGKGSRKQVAPALLGHASSMRISNL